MNHQNIFNSISAICRFFYKKEVPEDQEELLFWLSPTAGILPGLAAAVFAAVFVFFMGNIAGGVISALVLPLAFEVLTGWRGLNVTVSCFDQMFSGKRFSQISSAGQDNILGQTQSSVLFFSIYLFRMVSFGLFAASGNAVWFIYVFGGAYLIRGELYSEISDEPEESEHWNWLVYVCCILLAALFSFHWSAIFSLPIAVTGSLLLLLGIRKMLDNLPGSSQPWMFEFFGYLAENALFIIGLLLFGRTLHG